MIQSEGLRVLYGLFFELIAIRLSLRKSEIKAT